MTQRIQEAIDIYLDAINKGTLAKGQCMACAVGNLVAHGKGQAIEWFVDTIGLYTIFKADRVGAWGSCFLTSEKGSVFHPEMANDPMVKDDIAATKFTLEELIEIERAFESNTRLSGLNYSNYTRAQIREDQLNGLAAVIKVMLEFDEQPDTVEAAFLSKAALIPIQS